MALASAGPYASLHLAPDRQPCQHPTAQFYTGRMPFLPPNKQHQSTEGSRYRIDKYLDTQRPIATTADHVATDHFQKSQSQDGQTARVIISLFLLTQSQQSRFTVIGYAEAGRRISPMTYRLLQRRIPKFRSMDSTSKEDRPRLYARQSTVAV